jgi:asparagine synthetase B (glutamine-hydrolysing)
MFLVALTHRPVQQLLKGFSSEQFQLPCSKVLTVVTDGFLSACKIEQAQFTIFESPFINSTHPSQVIFSEVVVDAKGESICLFRSTMGGRPVYYHLSPEGELFCSSHISKLRKVGVPIEENTEVLPEFFVYRYVMAPQTLYRNVRQVVVGSRTHFKLREQKYELAEIEQYHPPMPQSGGAKYNTQGVADRTLSILDDSIRPLNLVNDRIALLLSGGLDSSILFKICQSNFGIDSTFSTGWPVPDGEINLEKMYAYSAAESFGAKHLYYGITVEDYLYGFLEAIIAAEEPVHHLQTVLLYLLFKKGLPESKDIVVSGEGADCLFGSSLRSVLLRSEKKLFRFLSSPPLVQLVEFAGHVSPKASGLASVLNNIRKAHCSLSDPNNIAWLAGARGSSEWVSRYFGVRHEEIIKGRYDSIKAFEERSLFDIVSLLFFFGGASTTTALWSKLGEDQKKILFYPYNNRAMLDLIYGIPWSIKVKRPKNVLREVATHLNVPEFIINRPKSAFGVKRRHWAVRGGWLEPLVPLTAQFFSTKEISGLQCVRTGKPMTFWNVLNYSIWKRLIIDNEPLERLRSELADNISRGMSDASPGLPNSSAVSVVE